MSTIGDLFAERLIVYSTPDLVDYAQTIGEMFDEFDLYVGLNDEDLGWSKLLDVDTCPAPGLPYLAQFVGEQLPPEFEETAARDWVRDRPNARRGTVTSIVAAARRSLTGSRVVAIRERDGDSDHLAVRTLAEQTPDEAHVYSDLRYDAVPADIALDYDVFTGATWGDVDAAYVSWAAVKASNLTWADVAGSLVGYAIYGTL